MVVCCLHVEHRLVTGDSDMTPRTALLLRTLTLLACLPEAPPKPDRSGPRPEGDRSGRLAFTPAGDAVGDARPVGPMHEAQLPRDAAGPCTCVPDDEACRSDETQRRRALREARKARRLASSQARHRVIETPHEPNRRAARKARRGWA